MPHWSLLLRRTYVQNSADVINSFSENLPEKGVDLLWVSCFVFRINFGNGNLINTVDDTCGFVRSSQLDCSQSEQFSVLS